VHRVDAEQATGKVTPIDPALAVDGIAEMVDVFLPLLAARNADATPGTVHLHAIDVEGEWLITLGPTITLERGHAKGDAAVRGAATYRWSSNCLGRDMDANASSGSPNPGCGATSGTAPCRRGTTPASSMRRLNFAYSRAKRDMAGACAPAMCSRVTGGPRGVWCAGGTSSRP